MSVRVGKSVRSFETLSEVGGLCEKLSESVRGWVSF